MHTQLPELAKHEEQEDPEFRLYRERITDDDMISIKLMRAETKRYEGEKKEGKYHGFGKLLMAGTEDQNRYVYSGQWDMGLQHGRGVVAWANGRLYKGGFCQGSFHGECEMRSPNQDWYHGMYTTEKKGCGMSDTSTMASRRSQIRGPGKISTL